MAKTEKSKFNPPAGVLPTLQYLLPQQLQIDDSYQRSIDNPKSEKLIKKIAQQWNWDRCLPLVVSRRENGDLYVIDGQHRLAAARLRGDIAQLPAVVGNYASAAEEAANFVHLNQERVALNSLQLFHAAVAGGDKVAVEIAAAIEAAGLKVAKSQNLKNSPPMNIINIGGIREARDRHGKAAAFEALQVLAAAFAGERLIYAGTIYPGVASVCRLEMGKGQTMDPARFAVLSAMLGAKGQDHWRREILKIRATELELNLRQAAERVVVAAWQARTGAPAAPKVQAAAAPAQAARPPASLTGPALDADGKAWCSQCEQRRNPTQAAACSSPFCKLKVRKAA